MDAEVDQLCAGGANSRNGYCVRELATAAGDVTLKIPKPRSGSFFPEDLAGHWSRVDAVAAAAVSEMHVNGVDTKKAERAVEELGTRPSGIAATAACGWTPLG